MTGSSLAEHTPPYKWKAMQLELSRFLVASEFKSMSESAECGFWCSMTRCQMSLNPVLGQLSYLGFRFSWGKHAFRVGARKVDFKHLAKIRKHNSFDLSEGTPKEP